MFLDKRISIWVDFDNCHTEDLWEEIGEAIENATVVLFLMSKDYQESKSCRQEVMYAKDSLKKRFIPIFIQKDFVATGWLGVRIVGPQYIRFGKREFNQTVKELIKLIVEDKSENKNNTTKLPPPADPKNSINDKNNNDQITGTGNNDQIIESNARLPKKPIDQWVKKDVDQWLSDNRIDKDLIDLYQFGRGNDLILYAQCLRPNWQNEYNDVRERYQKKYDNILYRDQFARFVGALQCLETEWKVSSKKNSKLCIIF